VLSAGMPVLPRHSSFSFLVLCLLNPACEADDDPMPAPVVRHVTAHALVWNGREGLGLPPGAPAFAPRILVFDSRIRCWEAFGPRDSQDAPTPGMSLEVQFEPEAWVSGARTKVLHAEHYDSNGHATGFEERNGFRPSFTAASVALLTAPTTNGSRAKLRLDMQVLFSRGASCVPLADEHVVDLSGDVEAEVCGDIQ
jgi:hypothetical protein